MVADHHDTIVVGGGWAGIAAATELTLRGNPVHLLESAKQWGGRGRSVEHRLGRFDNGQHLLIGAYRETLRLLDQSGNSAAQRFTRLPLALSIMGLNPISLRAPALPAPWHTAFALLLGQGLNPAERLAAIRLGWRLSRRRESPPCGMNVRDWLRRERQPHALIDKLWAPLCIAALNTEADMASARMFRNVLRDSLCGRRSDADLLIPNASLGATFAEPLVRFISDNGSTIALQQRVTGLLVEEQRIRGVRCGERPLYADRVVLATPAAITARLLADHLPETSSKLERLKTQPIVTVYLRYRDAVNLPHPMLGMDNLAQWVFERRIADEPNQLAVVISADGPHLQWDNDTLIARVQQALQQNLPNLPYAVEGVVLREKRATFLCSPESDTLRPAQRTAIDGLWLAGDYTDTGYPGTLEGAVRSGVQCARDIMDNAPLPK